MKSNAKLTSPPLTGFETEEIMNSEQNKNEDWGGGSALNDVLAAFSAIGQHVIDKPGRTAAIMLCALALIVVITAIAFGVANYPSAIIVGAIAGAGIAIIVIAGS